MGRRKNETSEEYRLRTQPYFKLYHEKHKLHRCKTTQKWRKNNKTRSSLYFKNNRNKINSSRQKRYYNNINFKLSERLRKRIYQAIKNNLKSDHTIKLLGCSIPFFKKYLESKFKPGMAWSNYNYYGWHIDHIRPCSSFDLSNPNEQIKCCHYTNLQPLWRKDNLRKSNRYI